MADKKLTQVKTGLLSRGMSLARLSLRAGSSLATHQLKRLGSGNTDESIKNLLMDQARILADELGQLKGSLMKVGQMLSMYGEHFLPPEANSLLKSLQFQSPPLKWPAIEKVLKNELGPERLKELEIEHKPMASASLGQVHAARIKATGERIALKVQYPDVNRAVESDLRALRGIFAAASVLPRIPHLDHLFLEVQSMLHQELDYELERKNTDEFRDLLKDDNRFVVPRTYARYSTSRILATELLEGHAVDDSEVQALSLERRNRLSGIAFELYMRELFEFGAVQTDPHLGNYRIRIDAQGRDQLLLFDFGALRRFSKEFIRNYRGMSRAAILGNRKDLESFAVALGFLNADDPDGLKDLFCEFCNLIVEPFTFPEIREEAKPWFTAGGAYRWKQSDLPRRMASKVGVLVLSYPLREPPREVVFLDRKTGGVFIFQGALNAEFNPRPLLARFLDLSTSEKS